MKIRNLLTTYFLCCSMSIMAQNTYHVSATSGNDANDGKSWQNAFASLQAALDIAQSNDEIWVAAGTYYPTKRIGTTISTTNEETTDRHRSFVLVNGIRLYGGFPAGNNSATMNDRDWETNETILSGDFNEDDQNDFSGMSENAYHVIVLLNADDSTLIDGFTITGGNANGKNGVTINNIGVGSEYGGGIFSYTNKYIGKASPKLANLIIRDNVSAKNGGGIYNYSDTGEASPTITYSTITHNKTGDFGGGVFIDAQKITTPVFEYVIISGNESGNKGGGIYCLSEQEVSSPHLTNVLICGNFSKDAGGMICYSYAGVVAPQLINVTISGNRALEEGGGFACSSGYGGHEMDISSPKIINSIIWGNSAGQGYTNIFNLGSAGSAPEIHNSLIEGEPETELYSSESSINPIFVSAVDPSFAPTTEGNYQLSSSSPAINKGDNLYSEKLDTDLAGNVRIYGDSVDMGAYEYQGFPSTGNVFSILGNQIWAAEGQITVQTTGNTTTIRVYTTDGKLCRQYNNVKEGTTIVTLPSGFYFVSLNGEGKAKVFVK